MESKRKKILLIVLIVIIAIAMGAIIGFIAQKNSKVLNTKKLENLISTPYTINKQSEKGKKVSLKVVSKNMKEQDICTLINKIYDKCYQTGDNIHVDVVNADKVSANNVFYTDGLLYRADIDYEKKTSRVASYQRVPTAVITDNKTMIVPEYSGGQVSKTNYGAVALTLNMTDVDSPSKASKYCANFAEMFKNINKDKKIDSVEVYVNKNAVTNVYGYSTANPNIIQSTLVSQH